MSDDAPLSSSELRLPPLTPSSPDPPILESSLRSADTSVSSAHKSRNKSASTRQHNPNSSSAQQFTTSPASHSLANPIQSSKPLLPPVVASATHSMSTLEPTTDARPPKLSSSTNNLFSSSCQPMRNTPNGESFAKVRDMPPRFRCSDSNFSL
jgi:hypothetical protein